MIPSSLLKSRLKILFTEKIIQYLEATIKPLMINSIFLFHYIYLNINIILFIQLNIIGFIVIDFWKMGADQFQGIYKVIAATGVFI